MAEHKNFKANHGKPFHADSVTVMHGDKSFVIDFKHTTPRVDQIDDDVSQTFITDHNAVVVQPRMMKVLVNILEENIANYEEKFGELPEPEDTAKTPGPAKTDDAHSYIG